MVDDSENFFTTRWTRVARSRGDSEEAQVALAELCESYYMPVEAFIRATTKDKEAAADLTQAFFARILSGPAFASADPGSPAVDPDHQDHARARSSPDRPAGQYPRHS